jgi:hypothetical protein
MTQYTREKTFGVVAIQSVDVRVTKSVAAEEIHTKKQSHLRERAEIDERMKATLDTTYAITLTLTSPLFGGSTVIVSAKRGCFGPRATMALHVMVLPWVDMLFFDAMCSDVLFAAWTEFFFVHHLSKLR